MWKALAYRGQVPTVEEVTREVRRRSGLPSSESHRPLRRAAVAGRLANQGPAVAGYVASYWAAHRAAPTWVDIARALHWPGDAIDHERALRALARVEWIRVEWIRGDGTDPTYPGHRWTERSAQPGSPPTGSAARPADIGRRRPTEPLSIPRGGA